MHVLQVIVCHVLALVVIGLWRCPSFYELQAVVGVFISVLPSVPGGIGQ